MARQISAKAEPKMLPNKKGPRRIFPLCTRTPVFPNSPVQQLTSGLYRYCDQPPYTSRPRIDRPVVDAEGDPCTSQGDK